ncbi:Uncharacterised protein [Rodentibacter pneumotropicus]|nr:Uncharacterised protein [Rodentibacter pneumotropicus]
MQFSPEILLHSWQNEEIGGKDILRKHIDQIFEQFVI